MFCNGCKYHRSNSVWNYCIFTELEYYFEPVYCDFRRREGEDDADFDY